MRSRRGVASATIHIFFNGLSFPAAILHRLRQIDALLPGTRRDIQEEAIMIDQEMHLPVRDRTAPHNDGIGQAIAAIIAITRREWMAQGLAPAAPDEAAADRARYAHPLIRFALDAKRSSAWRARAERQGWLHSVERLESSDRAS